MVDAEPNGEPKPVGGNLSTVSLEPEPRTSNREPNLEPRTVNRTSNREPNREPRTRTVNLEPEP